MRKSPIAIALALAMIGSQAYASDSFDSQLNDQAQVAEEEKQPSLEDSTSAFDKSITQAKKTALTGTLYEDEQLKELREMLLNNETTKRTQMEEQMKIPLKPNDVTRLRKKLTEIEKAQNEPLNGIDFRIRNVTYKPEDNKPLIIQIADGYAAQVEFYDASGQPWTIRKDGVVGDMQSFSKKVMGEKRHISSFSLASRYKQSNAAVVLEGMPTTIPILLKASDSVVDGRVSVTIPKLGPNALVQPIFNHELNNVSPELVKLQGGDAPVGSKPLRVAGLPNSEAWYDGEHLYLSLPGRLLLPFPVNSSVSPTGRYLYKLAPTTNISISLNGERLFGTIEGLYQAEIRRARTVFDKGVK